MSAGIELFNLKGKRALITGSSQGIGYALARGLDQAGAEIILNGRNKEDRVPIIRIGLFKIT